MKVWNHKASWSPSPRRLTCLCLVLPTQGSGMWLPHCHSHATLLPRGLEDHTYPAALTVGSLVEMVASNWGFTSQIRAVFTEALGTQVLPKPVLFKQISGSSPLALHFAGYAGQKHSSLRL